MKPRVLLLTSDQAIGRALSEAIAQGMPNTTVETRAFDWIDDLSSFDLVVTAPDELQLLIDESRSQATEEADDTHDQLLGVLFHELRTPLTPILAWAQLLKHTNEPGRIEMGADVIERNVRTQMSLVDDVLDINRLRRQTLVLDPRRQDLGSLIQEAVQPSTVTAAEKGVQMTTALAEPNSLQASVDGARIKQIVAYLVSNAVRFTPSGGSVTVSSARESAFGTVSVLDTGLGIGPEELQYVFDPFRVQTSARNQGTAGIHLALARALAELHGGTLEASSSGVGAEFRLRVPLAIPGAGSAPS